jgi:hypothetical protein
VIHALDIRRALLQENYHRFFVLYKTTPDLGNCILDLMVGAYRFRTLQRIFRAYKPSIEESFVIQELGFESQEAGKEFLASAGCVCVAASSSSQLSDNDDSSCQSVLLDTKASILIPPKDESGLLL